MKDEFKHAANESPRSGGSKRTTPLLWFVVVAAIVAIVLWFGFGAKA